MIDFVEIKRLLTYITDDLDGPVVWLLAAHAKGPGFDSAITHHVQRLISLAFTYDAIGSLANKLFLGPTTWVHFLLVPLDSIV